jgi:multidrug efflux system outer membrane protein
LLTNILDLKKTRLVRLNNTITSVACAILLMQGFTSCVLGPNYKSPDLDEPETYRTAYPASDSIVNMEWWAMYQDTVLQNLIQQALDNNLDLKTAASRIEEAVLNLNIVRANLYPGINYAVDGTANWESQDGSTSGSVTPLLNVSYQVDIWGRIRRQNEAALNEYLATEQGYRQLTIFIISQVAESYLLLRDLDNRLLISEKTAETWKLNQELVLARLDAGMVSEVDYNQAMIQLAEARSTIQTFTRLRAQTENVISTLLGMPPQAIPRGLSLQDQVFPPDIPVGLPSQLLSRRPDLLEAERRLAAQSARIGVAEALKYPQLTLSADMAVQFANPTVGLAGLGAQLFGPLFYAGANKRRVEVEIQRTQQLLYAYEQSFLNALREVENAMIAVNTYELEFQERLIQMNAANTAVELTWVRYQSGLTSYLEVLDLQRSQFSSQLKTSETLQLQMTSIVHLYLALGGGWYEEE